MNIQTIELSKLIRQRSNPNKMGSEEFAALKENIRQNGFLQPILVQQNADGTYTITDGHHRVEAMTQLGAADVTAVVTNGMSPSQVNILQLAMNKNRGTLQLDIVEQILRELVADGASAEEMSVTGYSMDDIDRLLRITGESEPAGAVLETKDGMELPSRPVTLEIPMANAEELRAVKAALKKASGAANDITVGLKHLLGMEE